MADETASTSDRQPGWLKRTGAQLSRLLGIEDRKEKAELAQAEEAIRAVRAPPVPPPDR